MADLIADASGSWSTQANWRTALQYGVNATATYEIAIGTTYTVSSVGISNVKNQVTDGLMVLVRRIPGQTSGTLTVAIYAGNSLVTATETNVDIAHLGADPSTYSSVSTEQYTWVFAKFASNYTFSSSSTIYKIAIKASGTGIFTAMSSGASGGTENWCGCFRGYSTTGTAPTTYDNVYIPVNVVSGSASIPSMAYNLTSCTIGNGLNGVALGGGISVSTTAGTYAVQFNSQDADPDGDYNTLYFNAVRLGKHPGDSGESRGFGAGSYTFGVDHFLLAAGKYFRAGTEASPLPANVNFTLKVNAGTTHGASQCYGITVKGELSLCGAAKTYDRCKISGADIAGGNTVSTFTSDVTTGWAVGDTIVVAGEQRTIQSINGTSITVSSAFYRMHRGTNSGDFAEWVINVTRNVILAPQGTVDYLNHTIWIQVLGTGEFNAVWAELKQIGGQDWPNYGQPPYSGYPGFPYSHGINMPTVDASWKVQHCAFRDCAGYITRIEGYYGSGYTGYYGTAVFQDNVVYGMQSNGPFALFVGGGAGGSGYSVTGNIIFLSDVSSSMIPTGGIELDAGADPPVAADCPDVSDNYVGYGQWYVSNNTNYLVPAYYNYGYYMHRAWHPSKFTNNTAMRCMVGFVFEHNATPLTFSGLKALHCSHGIDLGPMAGDARYMDTLNFSWDGGPIYETEHWNNWYWVVENLTFSNCTLRDPYSTSYDAPNEFRMIMVNVPVKNIVFDTCTITCQAVPQYDPIGGYGRYNMHTKLIGSHQPRVPIDNVWFKDCTLTGANGSPGETSTLGVGDRNFNGSVRITGGSYTLNGGGRYLIGSYASFKSGGVYVAPNVTGVTGSSDAFPSGVYAKRNGYVTKDTVRYRTATPAERLYTQGTTVDTGAESTPKRFVLPAGKSASITAYVRKAVPYTSPPAEYDGAPGFNYFIEGKLFLRYNPDITVNSSAMTWVTDQGMGQTTAGYGSGTWEALTSSGYTIATTVDTVVEVYVRAWLVNSSATDNRWLSIDDWTVTVS